MSRREFLGRVVGAAGLLVGIGAAGQLSAVISPMPADLGRVAKEVLSELSGLKFKNLINDYQTTILLKRKVVDRREEHARECIAAMVS